jgi:hypothetical protein
MQGEGGATMEGNGGGSGGKTGEELVVTEKPKVSWGEVVGLRNCKKAVKEAIVYPVQRPDLVSAWLATWHFACLVLLAAVKHCWQRRLQQRLMPTFTALMQRQLCQSGLVKQNRMLLNCSVQQGNLQLMVNQL